MKRREWSSVLHSVFWNRIRTAPELARFSDVQQPHISTFHNLIRRKKVNSFSPSVRIKNAIRATKWNDHYEVPLQRLHGISSIWMWFPTKRGDCRTEGTGNRRQCIKFSKNMRKHFWIIFRFAMKSEMNRVISESHVSVDLWDAIHTIINRQRDTQIPPIGFERFRIHTRKVPSFTLIRHDGYFHDTRI